MTVHDLNIARKYSQLIRSCLDHQISAKGFESHYLEEFKNEPGWLSEELFQILEELFTDVDAYWPECLPGQETEFEISEQRLRERAAGALQCLEEFLRQA